MTNTNCTFYINGVGVRGKLGKVGEYGHSVGISVQDYKEHIANDIPGNVSTVFIPGIASYLIVPDDSVTIVEEVISDIDMSIDSIRTIEHSVDNWEWRAAECPGE